MSASLHSPGTLDITLANNIGADVVTVRSGALTMPADSFSGAGNPTAFGFEIVFTTPYVYRGGSLLITTRQTGNGVDNELIAATTIDSHGQSIGNSSHTGTTDTRQTFGA